MQSALAATGLKHAFQTVVTGDDVYRGRPDPEAYLFAAQQLGRPTVRCVVVGNSNQVQKLNLRPAFYYVHFQWQLLCEGLLLSIA